MDNMENIDVSKKAGIKSNTKTFIARALLVERHKDSEGNHKYDYSKVEYKTAYEKVLIICKRHGEFWQVAASHLDGNTACVECRKERMSLAKKDTTSSFIEKARKVHGEKFDYSKVKYKRSQIKVLISCPIHGEFEQTPAPHLKTNGCPKCGDVIIGKKLSYSTETFIEKAMATQVHKDEKGEHKYTYEKVEYVSAHQKVIVTCKKHGDFPVDPASHLYGVQCQKCNCEKNKSKVTTEQFLSKLFKRFPEFEHIFDYSKSEYVRSDDKILVGCKKNKDHGFFPVSCSSHYRGSGCPDCYEETRGKQSILSYEEFYEKIKDRLDEYDISLVKDSWVSAGTKIKILCKACGVYFEMMPTKFMQGQRCRCYGLSTRGEIAIKKFLISKNILFKKEFTHKTLRNPKTNRCLKIDFVIYEEDGKTPKYAIEYNGSQHMIAQQRFGGEEGLKETQFRDKIKRDWLKENNIPLLDISYKMLAKISKVLEDWYSTLK